MRHKPSSKQTLSVSVISVTFNSSKVVDRMLCSVPASVPTVLVENGSDDINAIRGLASGAEADLIGLPENIGFGRACNLGAEAAQTEFLLFLNPDAELLPGALEALVNAMQLYPQAVAMNPAMLDARGRSAFFKRGSVLLSEKYRLPRDLPTSTCVVPVLSGAALLVRRTDFDAINGFDPRILLYHEDDDLSLRLAKRGDLMVVREAIVRHTGGKSTARTSAIAGFKAWHMGRSRVYATRKHNRPRAFSGALMQSVLRILSPFTWFSSRKRAKHMGFLRGVWSMRNHNVKAYR